LRNNPDNGLSAYRLDNTGNSTMNKSDAATDEVNTSATNDLIESLNSSGFGDRLKTLSNGVNTMLTREFDDEGVNLSGGEIQKVAIARVFFKPCQYIILDEPSSALDPISEYNLNKTMLEAAKNKTVVFISHRLSTTRMADRIFMLEDGCIVEQGSHEELMELNGKYAEMFEVQSKSYIDEETDNEEE